MSNERRRELALNLYSCLMCDSVRELYRDTLKAFGIKSVEHYDALYYPVRNGEISLDDLERVTGNGDDVTHLVRSCKSNPHPEITFNTLYGL